ncbi:MAG: GMC family oxidoreductase [Alphaproteobacteria bacterium]|nr:GMC family oxidoreductase [Alphaproteobacteria bacterium]
MSALDGRSIRTPLSLDCDVVVVGSGPAGSAVARRLATAGAAVVVVEAGHRVAPTQFARPAFSAMAATYRDLGSSVVVGSAPIPYVQGRMVGGTSPINGAICWRLPRDVWEEWVAADPALGDAIPWERVEKETDEVEARLDVRPTDPAIAGPNNELMARGAEALGLDHRPIRRNVVGCEGLGRCMQGCPAGHKRSVDRTLLQDAEAAGARLLTGTTVRAIEQAGGRAVGIRARTDGGAEVRIQARHAVVLAASAVQTPVLLLQSGIGSPATGEGFAAHPGLSLSGRFAEPVRMWTGATQGHEVTGLRHEGLKFEALGYGHAIMAARIPAVGRPLAAAIADLAHEATWGVALRARARGRVRSLLGRTVVTYSLTPWDIQQLRRGLRVLGEMMLAAGAEHVSPGVRGAPAHTSSLQDLVALERDGPRRASAFRPVMTHLFGTCRMGSDPLRSVVRPDFRHHGLPGLYVADSSVFPSNTGVNPQVSIMALASLCARSVLAAASPAA